jgi:hypothetical protein
MLLVRSTSSFPTSVNLSESFAQITLVAVSFLVRMQAMTLADLLGLSFKASISLSSSSLERWGSQRTSGVRKRRREKAECVPSFLF